ncbi:MAG: UTP-glucose-1-phosphate uridylyltransferase [candidate division TM6 bacterium GW2011_GWF2_37_49]|nr:MAG: UTP-glucose-1-phosphate uridylyltransferase [candidate division TM6 bacterium GW2011_GWF2_37_49]
MVIAKSIIPAGGLGTRFLPATKTMPKEMLPILDKPAIQYIAEEGAKSGIKTFIVITGKNKKAIEDHFDSPDTRLKDKGKEGCFESLNKVIESTNFVYIRQKEALGLGHAVWSASHLIYKEHVAIMLPDEIITGPIPAIAQLMQIAQQEKCNVVGVQEVPLDQVSKYGIIGIKKQFSPNLFQVKELVEKPSIANAPSNLALIGRYVLSPNIFTMLGESKLGVGGEIQLTDAMQNLLYSGEKVFAYKIQGNRYDIGNPLGLLKANLDFALRHEQYSGPVMEYLKNLEKDMIILEGQASRQTLVKPKSATLL